MAIDVVSPAEQVYVNLEQLDRLAGSVDSSVRNILYFSSDQSCPQAYGHLLSRLGHDGGAPVVEMPFRKDAEGQSFVYQPGNPYHIHDKDEHVSGLTGVIAGSNKFDVPTRAWLIERVAYAASTPWYDQEEYSEPSKVASRAMTAHHARRLVREQIDGMLQISEFRRRMMRDEAAEGLIDDLSGIKEALNEAWPPVAGRTAAAIGAVMAGAAVLIAAKKRSK